MEQELEKTKTYDRRGHPHHSAGRRGIRRRANVEWTGIAGNIARYVLGAGTSNGVRIDRGDIQPAKELPQTPADVDGIFDHRQDQNIFVGTGNFTVRVQADQSGTVETASHYDGPVIEVVVTSQTTLYEDVTMQQFNGPSPEGQNIQQVLESGSLDGIGESSGIMVWGKKTGDRIIADVLVYLSPVFKRK